MLIMQHNTIFLFKNFLLDNFGARCEFSFLENEKKYLVCVYDNSLSSSIFTKIARIKKDIEKNNCLIEWAEKPGYIYGEAFKISSNNLSKWILANLKIDFRDFNEWIFSQYNVMELLRKDLSAFVAYKPNQENCSYVSFEYIEKEDEKNIKNFLDGFGAAYVINEKKQELKIFIDTYNRLLINYATNGLI